MTYFLSDKQKLDITFFDKNLEIWAADPLLNLKFAVISDQNLQGFFDTFENALSNAVSKFQPYDFIIQQIIKEEEISDFLYSAYSPVQG